MIHTLKHPYVSVCKDGQLSYGGNQAWLSRTTLQQCGCGAVAMADVLCYLSRAHHWEPPEEYRSDPIPLADYDRLVSRLQLHYLPMVPPFGINGVSLAAGLGLYCKVHHLPLNAFWGVQQKNFWAAMADMLDRDLPVIFAVGVNFPFVWTKYKLHLYRKCGETYLAVSQVKAHYITATGLDETWIRVSSWGKEYYIHREEYMQYGRAHSMSFSNNLLWLP